MLAVTTMSPKGYDQYGRTFLYGLQAYWPGRIIAYMEGPQDDIPDRVEVRDFHAIEGWQEWLAKAKLHPGTNGGMDGSPPDGQLKPEWRYDAQKYCRKVFAQDAVFDEDEFVWWIDADCVIHKPIPESFLSGLLEKYALAYLGRIGRDTYTETGVIGFNTKHADFDKFRASYLPWVKSGMIFGQLKGWHDCIAFDHAREGVSSHNLSPRGKGFSNVIVESRIGEYMHHYKGNRKSEIHRVKVAA